ncbi:LysM peptidoglycan-binding domain-containing protein [Hallella absiana]|uniref:LysM peptidoglycan-binding domain-containing protein n=1 Tax=Hallella absiana TaxID=2925336 RepID=UPI0021C5E9E2|nr:LysM peptidoglycan-binding domain-containing protein [Hallella absiana]
MTETKHIKCPVCGKVDIPDYHKGDVVCPSCGSDLSVYRMLYEYQGSKDARPSKPIWKVLTLCSAIVAIILACLFLNEKNNNAKVFSIANSMRDSMAILQNQIVSMERKKAKAEKESSKSTEVLEGVYVIKRGDSFCKISKNIFGSERKYKQIAKNNNLSVYSILHVGDTLKINR